MNFRQANASDAESIAALHAESWRRTYRGMMPDAFLDGPVMAERLAAWRERLNPGRADAAIILALEDAAVAGFICLVGGEDSLWGSYVDNLHVASSFQRRGVGAALMARGAAWLEQEFASTGIYLWVMEANTAARHFYDRLGARCAETLNKSDPGGGTAPNCRYVWESPASLLCAVARRAARRDSSIEEINKAIIANP